MIMTETDTMQRALTPEEVNQSLAQRDRPKPKQSNEAETFRLIGKFVQQRIDAATAPLQDRIAQLERHIEKIERRKYVGVWSEAGKYFDQQMVTLHGSIFCCIVAETTQRPATGPDWVLCVQRGRDGKDGVDANVRRPTMQRSG
jgi:hypothetical protein